MSLDAPNRWDSMKEYLLTKLNDELHLIQHAIHEAGDRGDSEIDVRATCSNDIAEVIQRIFNEKQTFLMHHLREWARRTIRCNVETRRDTVVFSWNDPTLFAKPGAPRPRYGDET